MIASGRTWVLVADGAGARCFEEARKGAALSEMSDWTLGHTDADVPNTRDRPTRIQESVGKARHSVEKARSPHEEEQRRFLLRVAEKVNAAAAERRFDHLVLFAPPRALGELRVALSDATLRLLAGDQALDVSAEDAKQIAARLKRLRQPEE
jgi:protein required for attachment to host cells